MKRFHPLFITFLAAVFILSTSSTSNAEPTGWVESYQRSNEFLETSNIAAAAEWYYRAQLASSWAKEMRPKAFVGNGDDPGTFRAAINNVLGGTINPWAFQEPKSRLLPILDTLQREVDDITNLKEMSLSIYSGLTDIAEKRNGADVKKYPFTIPKDSQFKKFKDFTKSWIEAGREAANR